MEGLLVLFTADGAFLSVWVLVAVVLLALATEDHVTTSLDHNLLLVIHAHDAEHFIRNRRGIARRVRSSPMNRLLACGWRKLVTLKGVLIDVAKCRRFHRCLLKEHVACLHLHLILPQNHGVNIIIKNLSIKCKFLHFLVLGKDICWSTKKSLFLICHGNFW